jgi:hypothetical protein
VLSFGRRLIFGDSANDEPAPILTPNVIGKPPKAYVFGGSSTEPRATALAGRLASTPSIVGKWDLGSVHAAIDRIGRTPGVEVVELGTAEGYPIHRIRIPSIGEPKLQVLITGGVHGREPAGVAGALYAVDEILSSPWRREGVEYTVIPLVGPWGYDHRKRNNRGDHNLNRFMRPGDDVPDEVKVVRPTLTERRYDVAIDLHSAVVPQRGFFALHRGGLDVLGPAMERFRTKHPVVTGEAEPYFEDSPGIYTSRNSGTLKDLMVERGTVWSYTIESSLKLAYEAQVRGHGYVVECIVDAARAAKAGLAKAA